MTIIDYSAIAIAAIFSQDRPQEIEEGLIRHMILNRIRMYNLNTVRRLSHVMVVHGAKLFLRTTKQVAKRPEMNHH